MRSEPHFLMEHMGIGEPWDLCRSAPNRFVLVKEIEVGADAKLGVGDETLQTIWFGRISSRRSY